MYLLKLFLFISLSFYVFSLSAQQQKKDTAKIHIIHSDNYFLETEATKKGRMIGSVDIKYQTLQLLCDSLHHYSDSNYIEAFGNVHAIQLDTIKGDTVNLWGNFLNYNGNTQLAQVRDNVIMKDKKITLTTNFLDYDATNRVGYYFNKGTIKDSINTLKSETGHYYLPINEMFFKDSVKVYTPDYTMFSDTMKYQTETKIITILGPTNIYGDNRTLYSEDGWYNSITSHAELYKNNRITYNDYWGVADTIVVDSITNSAIMKQHIQLHDTVNNVIIGGNYGEVLKNNDYAFVTQKALLTLVGETDSLFIHGDTLSVNKDSIGSNVMKAYHHTKFYSKELQGLCDSMVFPVADSTVYLYINPIVWAGGNQMTATDITMHLKNNQVERFNLNNKGMIINEADTNMYNQIKGRNITGYMKDNELYLIYIDGSGEAIYYPDDQGVPIGLDRSNSSSIKIEVDKRQVKTITFINKVDGQLYPFFMLKPEEQKFKDFQWHINKQPKTKEDIFIQDIPIVDVPK